LASSQPSTPAWTSPSPQTAGTQALVHASVSSTLPSSQVSTPAWSAPSPQAAAWQVLRHSSVSSRLASSQASPGPTMPSPQTARAAAAAADIGVAAALLLSPVVVSTGRRRPGAGVLTGGRVGGRPVVGSTVVGSVAGRSARPWCRCRRVGRIRGRRGRVGRVGRGGGDAAAVAGAAVAVGDGELTATAGEEQRGGCEGEGTTRTG
jgi:hypothetical protein